MANAHFRGNGNEATQVEDPYKTKAQPDSDVRTQQLNELPIRCATAGTSRGKNHPIVYGYVMAGRESIGWNRPRERPCQTVTDFTRNQKRLKGVTTRAGKIDSGWITGVFP